jgi:hypothetical protein
LVAEAKRARGVLRAAHSRALLPPAEMLVIERKRGRPCVAGSGGMKQPDHRSECGVTLPSLFGARSEPPALLPRECRRREHTTGDGPVASICLLAWVTAASGVRVESMVWDRTSPMTPFA